MKKLFNRTRKSKSAASKPTKPSFKKLSFKQGVSLIVLAGVLLFGLSGYYWYNQVFTDPDRVLSDMLNKSMQTSSIHKTVTQEGGQSTLKQSSYLAFSPKTISKSVTTLSELSQAGKTDVITENIGTKNDDFIRYTSINISSNGAKPDLKNIVGVWGKKDNKPESGQAVSFLNDALFMAVPFGNLNNSQRHEMRDEINKVNLYQYQSAEKENQNGRPVMVYKIDLEPKSLVQVLSKYYEVTGIGDNSELNPALYEGVQKVQLKLQVDLLSRHLDSVEFVGSGRKETYAAYNFHQKIDMPEGAISVDELQSRLQQLEQQQ